MTRASSVPFGSKRGVAILAVLLLVFLLLIAITGAFLRTTAERRNAMDASAQVDAFALAQAGIDRYLQAVPAVPASLPDSQTFTLSEGRAVVTLRVMLRNNSDTIYVITSRGENLSSRYAPEAPVAMRTVTQLLTWYSGNLVLPAAFVSLSGLDKNGNSGELSGVDNCHVSPAPMPSIPGVAVPSISVSNPAPDYSGPTNPIDGNPDNAAVVMGTPGVTGTAKDAIQLDWVGIKARTAIHPTYYWKTTSPTAGSWPTNAQISGLNWPIVFVEGNLNLTTHGQGLLIVTGDLTIGGSDGWDGLVLIGGTLTSNGNNTFYGAVLAGLNVMTGGAPRTVIGNGNKTFQYNSCFVKNSINGFAGWSRMGNAWTDNFPIY